MKKSIFLFFAAILCSMSIDAYAATQRYIYVGLSNNYHKWKNASQWGINHWGGTGEGVVPGSKITDLKTTITHSGCTFHMYRMYVYDDNKNFEFKGSDNWWDCKKENISISGTTKNALLFRDNDGGDGGGPTFYQTNYQEESIVSLSVSSNSVSVGEEVILTPTLTSNAEYNEITSTTYSVGTGATVSNGKFVATAAGTYTVTATITYNPKKFTGITKKVENITCEIVVSEVAIPHPVTSVTVAPTSVTIKQGATVTLTATVAPSNADDPSVTWSSDNNSVATVVNGVVTAVAVGTANITVTTVDGGFTATCAVKVKPLQYTFYAINSAEWPTVAAHYWEGADGGSAWPGANMVEESETINGFEIYSITISSDFVNIMFTNQIDGDKNKKTADLTTEGNDGKYYDIKDAKWYASLSEVPVPFDYYVIGTINGWAMGDANYGMKDDNKDGVYEKQITLAAGDHVIKVNDGTWDKQWQFSNLTATYVGVTEGTDDQGNKNGNIAIHLDAETTITIKLNPTKNELTLDGLTIDAPVVTYDYYVVGTINGWGLKDASYGMELSGDVYEKEVAFVIGKHELKINNGTWDNANTFGYDNLSVAYEGVSRGSGDGDNNIVIDLAEAKTITIKLDKNTKKITLEGLTQIHTVKATVNPAETGSVEGAKEYKQGEQATLTATPAEGYQFVNWTKDEEVVSTENPYTFTVTADIALVANFKKAVEEHTITLSGLLKYTNDWRGYTTLQNVEGDTAFFVYNYEAGVPAYGEDYTVTANLGELTLEGTGSWKLIDELETITAVLYNEERTAVYNVTVSAKAPEVHNLTCTDALYVENISEWMSELTITGVIDETALNISVYDWQEATAGTYYQVRGVLNDEVYIQPDSAVVTIVDTKLTIVFSAKDELDNTYNVNVTATPKPNTPLVVENATFTVDGDTLTIQGQWETKSVVVSLGGWSTTKYGEYNNAVLMTGTGNADDDIYAEFSAVLSKDGTTATLTGVAANWDGTKYDVTISGLAPAEATTALDNVDTAVAPAKVINNGQLIIIRNGVQYNAQGAVVK